MEIRVTFNFVILLSCAELLSAADESRREPLRQAAEQYEPVIQNLDDIEALAFFVLYRKYHVSYGLRDARSGVESPVILFNETLDDRTFQDFLLKLKYSDILKKSSDENISCEQLKQFYSELRPKKTSSRETDEEALARLDRLCDASSKCQSPADLINLIYGSKNLQGPSVSGVGKDMRLTLNQAIVRLCPVMLFQMHEENCAGARDKDNVIVKLKPSPRAVWGYSFLFVTIISFCSLIGVALMPFLNKKSFLTALNICEGLAVGSLVGSAIFHLIPQSFNLLTQDGNHGYLWKALIIFGGIYLFYWSERIMKLVVDYRRRKKLTELALPSITEVSEVQKEIAENERHVSFTEGPNGTTTGTMVSFGPTVHKVELPHEQEKFLHQTENGKIGHNGRIHEIHNREDRSRSNSFTNRISAHSHGHDHGIGVGGNGEGTIATIAWMIIVGDALHNFIDGLSIGAAFSESILAGISISVAVVCEEFPHELGDFAILIASGMSLRQAIGYNFLSACTCYIGMILGILVGDFTEGSTYILALAGGMFLYIALVDMMGELTVSLEEASKISVSKAINVLILQNIGILLGISTLFLLAKYSEHINFEGLVPLEDRYNPLMTN